MQPSIFDLCPLVKLDRLQDYTQHHDLVRDCAQGDHRAQLELYRTYCKAMFNICLRMMGTRQDAEDVLQNAFIDIFTKIETFRYESSVGAWIKRIVINHCINELKRRRLSFVDLSDSIVNRPDQEYAPVENSEEIQKIKSAIQQLPNGYRVVFSLYCIEGYDHREIAQILDISEGASKSQYSRAKKKLNEILIGKYKVG